MVEDAHNGHGAGDGHEDEPAGRPSDPPVAGDLSKLWDDLPPGERPDAVSYIIQNLNEEGPEQSVADMVAQLPPAEQQGAASKVFEQMDTPQKTEQVLQNLTSLPPAQLEAAVSSGFDQLSTESQKRVTQGRGLAAPDKETTRWLWKVVIGLLGTVILLFGTMAVVLLYQNKAAEAPLALATTALGGIVGLISPGPTSGAD